MPRFRSSPSVSLCLAAGSHHAVSPKGMPVGIQAALTGLFHGALTAVGAANVLCHNASLILFRVRRAVCARTPDDVPGMLHSPHAGGSASFCTGNFRLFSFAPLRIPNCCFCNRPPFFGGRRENRAVDDCKDQSNDQAPSARSSSSSMTSRYSSATGWYSSSTALP